MTVTTSALADPVTVVSATDAGEAALETSRAMFDTSPVVTMVAAGDKEAQLIAASTAVSLGVPLLVAPTGANQSATLVTELSRLKTTTLITIGTIPNSARLETKTIKVIALPADHDTVSEALHLHAQPASPGPDGSAVVAVAALEPHSASILTGAHHPSATPKPLAGDQIVPNVKPGKDRTDTLAIALGTPAELAAVATARAAAVDVRVIPESTTDLFASDDALAALAKKQPHSVLLIGAAFGSDPALKWKVAVATSGKKLPGGGERWFPSHTLIALYGVPGSSSLGILGEQDATKSVQRAEEMAAKFRGLTNTTVVPMFEIIATVAAGDAGRDGNFSNEGSIATISPWVHAAADAGIYVVLDLQPGRSDFLSQAKRYEPLLKLPNVGLALDPEWRLGPDQFPLQQTGTVDSSEVNGVISWLADLTRDNVLPQKVLVLHQFQTRMIGNRALLDTSREELAVIIHADGQGTQPAKQSTWNALHVDAPNGLSWGWKNFIDEDDPMLTPEQTMTQVSPPPNLVSYQ